MDENKQNYMHDIGDGNGMVHGYDEDGNAVENPCPDCGLVTVLCRPGGWSHTDEDGNVTSGIIGNVPDTYACFGCQQLRLQEDNSPAALRAKYLTAMILDEAGGPSELDVAIGDLEATWATS